MSTEFITPQIIGADAELQARLMTQLSSDREAKKVARPVSTKMKSFANNERLANRYEISNPVICYPVLDSREVGSSSAIVGIGADISTNGIRLILEGTQPNIGLELVIGVQQKRGGYQYCAGTVASSRRTSPTTCEVGVEFRGYMYEVF